MKRNVSIGLYTWISIHRTDFECTLRNIQPFSHNLKTVSTFLFKAAHLVKVIAYIYGTKV
jgi:hypothetical protein